MRWGFRSKLFVVTVGLISVSLVSADLYLSRALETDLTERVRNELKVRLALVSQRAGDTAFPLDDLTSWDLLADRLGSAAAARVTIVAQDGQVIGDSEVSLAELPKLENHATRPEIVAALAKGTGGERRWSDTVERKMIYAASRFSRDGVVTGVVRVGMPLTDVEQQMMRLHRLLGLGSVLALGVSLLLATLAAHIFGRALRDITRAAGQIAKGDLDVRIRADTGDEIGTLANTLDQLAGSLSSTLGELRAERDRLGRILEAMEEGVLVVDPERVIRMANPAACQLLLASAARRTANGEDATADLLGRSLLAAVRNADLDAILDKTLSHHLPASGEISVDWPRQRRLLVHVAPLGGEPHGAVVVLVDVTEIRKLESMRKDFVANVSHELRTPLTAVRTALETAQTVLESNPKEANRFLQIAERHSGRLAALVRDLLDLSRIESGRLALRPEPVDVAEVAAEVLELFQDAAALKKLTLKVDMAPDLPAAFVDRGGLFQVMSNLVENAVKYTDEGEVVVRAAPHEGRIQLRIEDSGPGIASRHLPRLFERFYRIDAGRSRDRGGTGLGLSIVKHLIDAMGGQVAVTSEVGVGSTFSVSLPAAKAEAADVAAQA